MKTIKQIADEIGVKKDNIKYRVRNLPNDCVVKEGNITYINEQGEEIIKGLVRGKSILSSNVFTYKEDENTQLNITQIKINELESEIKVLKRELEIERATAEEKLLIQQKHYQEVIEQSRQAMEDSRKWQALIEREQQLRMADKAQSIKNITSNGEKPAGFFSRLFGKRVE